MKKEEGLHTLERRRDGKMKSRGPGLPICFQNKRENMFFK